jgi:CheY-like chemotaxis protein
MEQPRPDDKLSELRHLVVLIVDDDDDCRELLATLLESRHAQVVCASSAEEALIRTQEALPHVVISDIAMPGEDGYAFMRKLRALPREQGGATPAIALTAFSQRGDRERALAAGFARHLPKPVDLAELCAEIDRLGRLAVPATREGASEAI